MGQHEQLVSNFHDASVLLATSPTGLMPPELQKHRGLVHVKLLHANYPHMPPCVRSLCVKMRSETKQRFTAQHNHGPQLWASLCTPWTIPGARQVFQAAGSERQASAMQIHHLSLPLLPSGKSDSTTALEEKTRRRKGGREGGRGDCRVGREGSD